MGIRELLAVLRRRWLVVVPIVLAGLLAGGYMMMTERPLYRADLAVALVADPIPGQDATQRQFWDQNGSRIAPALGDAMIEELRSVEVQKAVGGGRSSGTVDAPPGTSTSFAVSIEDGDYLYRLTAWAYDGTDARGAVEDAARQASEALTRLHDRAQAPKEAVFRAVPVGTTNVMRASASRSLRMPLGIVAASLMAGLLAGVLLDSASSRRRAAVSPGTRVVEDETLTTREVRQE